VAHPRQTVFTRFIPADKPGDGGGTWKRYYERWASMTIERLGREQLDLVPELAPFAPPAEIVDKHVYSPWLETDLHRRLRARGIDTLVVRVGETDVCVLGIVLGSSTSAPASSSSWTGSATRPMRLIMRC
jgi:nicotinamidase-related amidase